MLYEKEKKYLVKNVNKICCWDKEQIVYQWYLERSDAGSTKEKLIFDLLQNKVIYVRVQKWLSDFGEAKKEVQYLDINSLNVEEKIGIPFVLKRRAIKSGYFLDHFIVSNDRCKYLLEIEQEDNNLSFPEYEIAEDVTRNFAYYNQNMCVPFGDIDAERLQFLLKLL